MNKHIVFLASMVIVGLGLLALPQASAETPVISNIQVSDITHNSATITWDTDIQAQGRVSYGSSRGEYSYTTSPTDQGTSHRVALTRLSGSTVYFVVKAYAGAEETMSAEESFTLTAPPAITITPSVFGVNDSQARVSYSTNFPSVYGVYPDAVVEYGRQSGSYPDSARFFSSSKTIDDLYSGTTYYARIKLTSLGIEDALSGEFTFTTLSEEPEITDISPTSGPVGTRITLEGHGFSDTEGIVTIGNEYSRHCAKGHTEILSWSDTKIVAELLEGTDDPVFGESCSHRTGKVVARSLGYWSDSGPVEIFLRIAEGPVFTITNAPTNTNSSQTNQSTNTSRGVSAEAPVASILSCALSTGIQNANTVKVKEALTKSSERYQHLERVIGEYQARWDRDPRCDELQFHYDHNTDLNRLIAFLETNGPNEQPASAAPVLARFTQQDREVAADAGVRSFAANEDIVLNGTTTPNAIVILTIASDTPTTATTTADNEGKWSYTIPANTLTAGDHTVTVAIADKDLKPALTSDPISFTVTAAAASETADDDSSDIGSVWFITGIVLVLVLAVFTIKSRKKT